MRLCKITVSNFMSFGEDVTFDLPDIDDYMVLVRGGNGQGKSALFEAIYWCLTGTTVRGVRAEEVLRHGTKECVVEVTWKLTPKTKDIGPEGEYTIRRLWSKANKQITVERPGKRKDKVFHNTNDGTKFIRELVGIDPEVLALVAFFGRKFQTFSRMKPTERAHIIDLLARKHATASPGSRRSGALETCRKTIWQIGYRKSLPLRNASKRWSRHSKRTSGNSRHG
jgi:DNA repair exonuclease SbcCD ATPase subunit